MNELIKLEAYLKEHSIPYSRDFLWNQIVVFRDKELTKRWFDVVWHKGCFGYEEGLLELLDSEQGEDVEGYLTADDVIKRYFVKEQV